MQCAKISETSFIAGDWALKSLKRHLPGKEVVDIRTNYFTCRDFDKIPNTKPAIAENDRGNRGILFLKVKINGVLIPAVYKVANKLILTHFLFYACK